jgi:hypothetical protein
VAPREGSGAFWWESHRTELAYDDSAGVLYVRRLVGTAYPQRPRGTGNEVARHRNIKRYHRLKDAHANSPYVIVVAWPIGGGVDGFNVMLTTANPSLPKRLWSGLD